MSYELIAALHDKFAADATITGIIATDADAGGPAIYPYHHSDVHNPVYPMITLARFGDGLNVCRFDEFSPGVMDYPKFAVCAWSQQKPDAAMALIRRVDQLLRGMSVSSPYITSFRIARTAYRDDLFDTAAQAFHVHTEWKCWTQLVQGQTIVIPT